MIAPPTQVLKLSPHERPRLTVVVDTEEEFDWTRPASRLATAVAHMADIGRLQSIFEEHSLCPTYVIDYPIASQRESIEPLRDFQRRGRALIGAHLHTWVSPPFAEADLTAGGTYQCNLPPGAERAKLQALTGRIAESFASPPVIFKAGRYGIGESTQQILEDLGYHTDLSPAPPHDFTSDGGPDFSRWTAHPYWFGKSRRLLCLPRTGAFVGWMGPWMRVA